MKSKHIILTRPPLNVLALALTGTLLSASLALATPYASCLTNNSGVISFRLNEAADNVKVITNGVPIDLGARAAGVTVTNLGISGAYQVVARKSTPTAWTQISSDANTYSKYFAPRGVTVNQNPASPYFGRVYVSNAGSGTSGSRLTGYGFYMVNADLTDAIGNGNTAATAGITFATTGSDPYKISVGPDDSFYLNNFSTAQATTCRTDPNVSNGSAQQMLSGIGENVNPTVHTDSANTPIVLGSLVGGTLALYNVEGNYSGGFNRIARWDINGGPLPWNTAPTLLGWTDHATANLGVADLFTDLAHGPDGKFYTAIYRANNDTSVIRVYDTDANSPLWDVRSAVSATANGTLLLVRALAVSPLTNKLAMVFDDNHFDVLTLTNGIPDWGTLTVANFTGTAFGRAIAFDAAGNVYTVSSGLSLLRVFSPGGATVVTTSSTGSFSLSDLSTNVSVVATTALASEAGPVNGVFTITRTGDTSGPLTVNFGITGSATFGVDYILTATNSVTIAAGQSSTNVTVQVIDDAIPELTEMAVMTLSSGTGYSLVNPASDTVTIVDNETPDISITALYTNMYERVNNDFMQFQLTRRGLTNDAIAVNLSYGGTAVNGTDYTDPSGGVVTIPAGSATTTFKLNPFDNALLDGNRSIVVNVAPAGAGEYLANAVNNSVSGAITDDELGPVAPSDVLFTENFDAYAGSAANTLPASWGFGFIANNNVSDFNYAFGYDYSADGIPAPPNTATTFGLKATVNKNDTALSAAGINFYPVSQSFSGNYAMRFNMLLVIDSSSNQTEYATFGINHSGTKTNWWRSSAGGVGNARALNTDGLFYEVNSSGADGTDYSLMTQATGSATNPPIIASRAYTTMQQTFKIPPYGVTGEPGIVQSATGVPTTPTWVDVEVTQIGSMLTLRMNNTIVLQTTNTTAFTSGHVMLGYVDPYDSIGGFKPGYVIYDNLSVVRIYPLSIVTQPVSAVVIAAGNSTNLTVVTTGSATGVTNYQWQLNGVNLAGATNATLPLNNVQPANDGVYTVVVSDGVTTLTGTPTTFLVLTPGVVVGTGTGLRAGYWTQHTNNAPYTGNPALIRVDPTVNFDWVAGSPDPLISADYFTARWVGQVQALGTETYTFTTISDDGARLWVNGQLVVDSWVLQGVTARSGQIALTGTGKYDLVMEYFEQTGNAVTKLYWSNATTVGYSPVPQSQLYPAASPLPLAAATISGISGNSLNYSGGAGSQFVLLKTADLTLSRSAWTRVHTNTTPSGSFTIPLGSEARAFYTIEAE